MRRLGEIDFGYVARMLAVNTIGPLKLVETFRRNLAAGRERRLLIVSSAMGAIGANLSGGHYGYRASGRAERDRAQLGDRPLRRRHHRRHAACPAGCGPRAAATTHP